MYVNNVGKIIEEKQTTASSPGNNLYLTIDKNLQIATYKILEEQLAGIVVSNMQNVMNFEKTAGSDNVTVIPFDDVLNAFFSNSILDLKHFDAEVPKKPSRQYTRSLLLEKEQVMKQIVKELTAANAKAYKDLPTEMQAYMSFIANDVLLNGSKVLLKTKSIQKIKHIKHGKKKIPLA